MHAEVLKNKLITEYNIRFSYCLLIFLCIWWGRKSDNIIEIIILYLNFLKLRLKTIWVERDFESWYPGTSFLKYGSNLFRITDLDPTKNTRIRIRPTHPDTDPTNTPGSEFNLLEEQILIRLKHTDLHLIDGIINIRFSWCKTVQYLEHYRPNLTVS